MAFIKQMEGVIMKIDDDDDDFWVAFVFMPLYIAKGILCNKDIDDIADSKEARMFGLGFPFHVGGFVFLLVILDEIFSFPYDVEQYIMATYSLFWAAIPILLLRYSIIASLLVFFYLGLGLGMAVFSPLIFIFGSH